MTGAASGLMRSLQMGVSGLASVMVAALAGGKAEKSIDAVGMIMMLFAVLTLAAGIVLRWKRRIQPRG